MTQFGRALLLCAWLSAGVGQACGPTKHGSHDGQPSPSADAGAPVDVANGKIVELERECDGGVVLEISVLDDGSLRLHFVRGEKPQTDRGYTHTLSEFHGPNSAQVQVQDRELRLRTAELELRVSSGTCAPDVRDLEGRVVWATSRPWRRTSTGVSIARTLAKAERVFGLGERGGKGDRRGRVLTNWTSDPAWNDTTHRYTPTSDPLYQANPFFLSVLDGKVSGAYLANTYRSVFDVGHGKVGELAIEAAGGDIDLFVIDGATPAQILERYTRLVGRATLPPLWSLGYHQSRWSYTPAARLEEVGAELRKRALPADGLWLDIDYMDGYRDFTWNAEAFPDPKGLVKSVGAMGFKVTTILDPGLKYEPGKDFAALERGLARDVFIHDKGDALVTQSCWPGDAVYPDFSRPSARAWWSEELGRFYSGSGVTGTWIDMNEPSVFSLSGFPLDAQVSGDGVSTTFAELHNVYGLLMAKATYEGQLAHSPKLRPFLLTRSGFSGVQKYAAVWTGDNESEWETLAMLPAQLQGMSLSGLSFVGSDVGGFTSGAKTHEMYGRWFELGAFSPFFRSHVVSGAPDQEPWSFGPQVEAAARKLLELRYRLLPYWYQAFVEASETGTPVLRPLWWSDPSDEQSFAHEDEFFVGPSLLVALVTSPGVTSRKVYLPRGNWVEFSTGVGLEGPTRHEVEVPLGSVPMFVRSGSIIPTQALHQYVGEKGDDSLYLDLFVSAGDASGELSLYEDDGATTGYQSKDWSRTDMVVTATAQDVRLQLAARRGRFVPAARSIIVRLHGRAQPPTRARVDGHSVSVVWDADSKVAAVTLEDDALEHDLRFER